MKKKIIPIIVLLLLLVALPISFLVVRQQQDIRQKAAPATTMSFAPSEKTVAVGETFSLDIIINTGENSIVATSIHILFDNTKLEAQALINSPQFPNILSSAKLSEPGKASIAVGTTSISRPFKGTGTVGTIRFRALQRTETPVRITFGPETFAGSIGEGSKNALIGTSQATVIITNPNTTQPTPTASPTRIASPTIQPTQVTPKPQGSPSPSPTISSGSNISQLTIISPASGSSVLQDPPTLTGKSPPNSTVTISFSPGTLSGSVKADSSGNWSFKPNQKIGSGTYTVTIISTNPANGQTQTATSIFTIASSTPNIQISQTTQVPTATYYNQQLPVTGESTFFFAIIAIAISFIIFGFAIPLFIK